MQGAETIDPREAWRASHHAAVHQVLVAQAASTDWPVSRGTDGVLLRAQLHYDCLGKTEAVSLLERMNVAVFRMRQALLSGDTSDYLAQKDALGRMAEEWAWQAPLFQVAAMMTPAEGTA